MNYIQIIWLNLQIGDELEKFGELDDIEVFLIPQDEVIKQFDNIDQLHYKSSGYQIEELSWLLDNSWYGFKLDEEECLQKLNFTISKIIICGATIT